MIGNRPFDLGDGVLDSVFCVDGSFDSLGYFEDVGVGGGLGDRVG